jgi:DNA-binding XRE family transcriptional regulator
MANKLCIDKLSSQAEALGLNQSSIAKALGVSRETVSQWFKLEKYPRPDKLLKCPFSFHPFSLPPAPPKNDTNFFQYWS